MCLTAVGACSRGRSGSPFDQGSARSQTPDITLKCDYAFADIGVTYREVYAVEADGRTGRLVSSGAEPALPVRVGSVTVRDNAYEISFPELSVAGKPLEGSALIIQINRYSGDSARVQVDRSGRSDVTHRGHCVRFEAKEKL